MDISINVDDNNNNNNNKKQINKKPTKKKASWLLNEDNEKLHNAKINVDVSSYENLRESIVTKWSNVRRGRYFDEDTEFDIRAGTDLNDLAEIQDNEDLENLDEDDNIYVIKIEPEPELTTNSSLDTHQRTPKPQKHKKQRRKKKMSKSPKSPKSPKSSKSSKLSPNNKNNPTSPNLSSSNSPNSPNLISSDVQTSTSENETDSHSDYESRFDPQRWKEYSYEQTIRLLTKINKCRNSMYKKYIHCLCILALTYNIYI